MRLVTSDVEVATTTVAQAVSGEDTVRAAQSGDRAAQERVFAELYPLVRKQLYFQHGSTSHGILDEAVQESMMQIFRGLPRYRGEAKLSTWALKIAIRQGRRHAKRLRTNSTISLDDWQEAGFTSAPSATAAQLRKLLASLQPKKREAFILMDILEMTASEAGAALSVSANTAASRCRHARLELRRGIEETSP